MAATKLSATKSMSQAINYAEKRSVEKSDIDYAKSSFKASRELYGKMGVIKTRRNSFQNHHS